LAVVSFSFSWIAVASARAQDAAHDSAALANLTGLERARSLAQLVDAHKIDQPADALRYAAEALQLFKRYPDPAANISTLSEVLWPLMTAGKYDSATFYADSARRFAARIGDRVAEARATSNLGSLAQRMGDPSRAVDYFNRALSLQRAVGNDREIANSLNNLGFVYSTDFADYPRSLTDHLEALSIRERIGDKQGVALSLNNIGIVYGRLRQYDRALAYFDRALVLRRELGNKPRVSSTLSNIGDTYLDMGDTERALRYQRDALAIRIAMNDRSAIAMSHRNIGLILLKRHDLDGARQELLEAMQMVTALGDKGQAVQVRLALAMYERARGTPSSAIAYASQALAIADSMRSRELVRQATTELAISQETEGMLGDALEQVKRSKAVNDSIFNDATARRIATLEQRFSDERRLREIDSLRRTQAELRLKASQRAIQRDGAATVAILIAVIGFFLYRRRVERERLAESLSMTDTVTGIRNRRYVHQTIDLDIAASLRRNRTAAARGVTVDDADMLFFMVDIDHFKAVNDAHGHSVGDQLLIQIAGALHSASRDSDVVVRWGGDEFLVIARFTDRMQGAAAAERLRATVEGHTMRLPGDQPVRVTCSIGYAAFPFDVEDPEALSWESIVALADKAAYAAKRNGRNRWEQADASSAAASAESA
jgi:diguanylate cyclase (GGDEF)-like protein